MSKQADEWHNRPMVVTVKTHCDSCNQLKEGVETRSWNNNSWYHRKTFTLFSCLDCFNARVKEESQPDADPYEGCY